MHTVFNKYIPLLWVMMQMPVYSQIGLTLPGNRQGSGNYQISEKIILETDRSDKK